MTNRQALGLSIAAINDSASPRPRLDTLAPSKEAQEARLAQAYQDALQELQRENYGGARRLLESILQDPIILLAQTSNNKSASGTDSGDRNRMLQLRFSALKNLGAALCAEDSSLQNVALGSYLEAVSMDQGDVVLWNRLGTLACALGHTNIARCAFEQGLICSPRNWVCMEKLVEVLIAIGDEEACRYVVRRLLKLSPSHPRATYVDDVLEGRARGPDSLNLPGCLDRLNVLPRGLDLLEPQHSSLSFPKKRKFDDGEGEEDGQSSKRRMLRMAKGEDAQLSWNEIILSILRQIQVLVGIKAEGDSDFSPGGNDLVSTDHPSNAPGEPWINQPVAWQLNGETSEEASSEAILEEDNKEQKLGAASEQQSPSRGSNEAFQSGDAHSDVGDDRNANQMNLDAGAPQNGDAEAAALYEEELPIYDKRNFRQEKVRTRNSDKSESYVGKHQSKDPGETLRQLLEPYLSSSARQTGSEAVAADQAFPGESARPVLENGYHESRIGDAENRNGYEGAGAREKGLVQRFITAMKLNSGLYNVAHELVERLAAIELHFKVPFPNLRALERLTRRFSWTKRSRTCSLFFAELCLDSFMIASSPSDEESLQQDLTECDFHLCRVLECIALDSGPFVQSCTLEGLLGMASGIAATEEGSEEKNAKQKLSSNGAIHSEEVKGENGSAAFSQGERAAAFPQENGSAEEQFGCNDDVVSMSVVENGSRIQASNFDLETTDWYLWARFHWLNGRLLVCRERLEEAFEELTRCSDILDNRAKATGKPALIALPHCKYEPILTHAIVQSKLYELQIDKILKFTVPDMVEQGQYSELIDLLVPVLVTKRDNANGRRTEIAKADLGSSPQYACLDVLISACEKVHPANLSVALQCHTRKLEILLNAARNSCSSETRGLLGASPVENKLIAEEVKSISKCAGLILERLGVSGRSVIVGARSTDCSPPPSSMIRRIQDLLMDLMCHYIGGNQDGEGRSRSTHRGSFNFRMDGMSFVETVISFCRLQHLDPNASLDEQVSLLQSFHDVLAGVGLCCAGEGAFLKMAVMQLRIIELNIIQSAFQSRSSPVAVENGSMEVVEKLEEQQQQLTEEKEDGNSDSAGHEAVIDATDADGDKVENSPVKVWKDDLVEDVGQRRQDLGFDLVLDQCFYCLYGLTVGNSGSEISSQSQGLIEHRNANCGDMESPQDCAMVYQYVLPYAKGCTRFKLQKLKKILRAVHKQFAEPPPDVLAHRAVDSFLDDPKLDEALFQETLSSSGKKLPETIDRALRPEAAATAAAESNGQNTEEDSEMIDEDESDCNAVRRGEEENGANGAVHENGETTSSVGTSSHDLLASVFSEILGWNVRGSFSKKSSRVELGEPFWGVYENLYHFLSEIEDTSAGDKWAGFVLGKEGEDFVNQNASLLKSDLCCNPLRFESWFKLSKTYDEEAELILNDGSKRINVIDWRKDTKLIKRVEMCRQRTRRSLFVALALSSTSEKQSEMHELLALVFYESLQNVAPAYDQRFNIPKRDAPWISRCECSLKHFEKAFQQKPDWTHLFYMGKLYEKLGRPRAEAFDFYKRAVEMNTAAVDPIYRLHASRSKLLCRSERHDYGALRLIAHHCYVPSIKESASKLLESLPDQRNSGADKTQSSNQELQQSENGGSAQNAVDAEKPDVEETVTDIRRQLFTDCNTVMRVCIEGELKHYHKARFRLAHGYYTSAENEDIDRAKVELTFCFRSTRSQFTINMWEIDGSMRKIRRKAADHTNLDVQMPESSRKFITCVRKYLLLYLTICEKTGAINTLERAFNILRTDKKFSLCLDDISRLSLGKYIQALATAIWQADNDVSEPPVFPLLEKLFSLFMDYGSSWSESLQVSLAESRESVMTENIIYGYIHRYLNLLENEVRLDTLEGINEKIRKRSRSLYKLSCSQTAEICRHACLAWSRALCVSLASITPVPTEKQVLGGSELQLIVDVQEDVFRASSYKLESDGSPPSLEEITATAADPTFVPMSSISSMKRVPVGQAAVEDLEKANSLLRSTYVFFRDSPSGSFARGISLLLMGAVGVSSEEASGHCEVLDLSMPRKLLVWAFALVHGRAGNVTEALRFCEEHLK